MGALEAKLIQSFSFIAILTNILLAYLIISRSRKEMGNYRYLILAFTLVGLHFTLLNLILVPFVDIYKHAFVFYPVGELREWPNLMQYAFSYWHANYGSVAFILVLQFAYRYGSLVNQKLLRYFCLPKIGYVLGIPIQFREYLRDRVMEVSGFPVDGLLMVKNLYVSIDTKSA
ncbi:unnamed protein product, partial [Mesorhabditis spiculigera]